MHYYFAYASNLRHIQMDKRCPHAKFVGVAKINDMRLAFTGHSMRWGGAPATIIEHLGSEVWGAIFELDKHCVRRLDKFEGLTTHNYHHKNIDCHLINGEVFKAYTYVRNKHKKKERLPSKKYMNQIIKGAYDCTLPEEYILKLKSLQHR